MIGLYLLSATGLPQRITYSAIEVNADGIVAPEINAIAPDFERITLSGETINLSDFRGQPVIINFWATWCEPCLVEMHELQALQNEIPTNSLKIFPINMGEDLAIIKNWLEQQQLILDPVLDETMGIAELYHLRGQPSTYIVSPSGVITNIYFGATTADELRNQVSQYLE